MLATYTAATNDQPEVPEYVRQAGVANGIPVYFVVYPIFRHGASGPVVGYKMSVIADGGYSYGPADYLIFPAVVSDNGQNGLAQPVDYLSVVPDGVRRVRWHFICRQARADSGCGLPATTVSVPVHDNLAVLPITNAGDPPTVNRVTWYRAGGSGATFNDQNAAVPFPGAPAWPTG